MAAKLCHDIALLCLLVLECATQYGDEAGILQGPIESSLREQNETHRRSGSLKYEDLCDVEETL